MSFCDLHFFSHTLGKQVGAYVLLPDKGKPPFATFYLLHGLSDDHTIWMRRTRIEAYASDLPMIVVMPDGGRGFYTDNAAGPAWGTFFAEELPNFIERTFPAGNTRESRCVGGLSMGGYGALRLALAHPDRFASANSHSGAVMHGSRNHPRAGGALQEPEFRRIFGEKPEGSEHDLVALARKAEKAGVALPKLRIDCGVDDDLLEDNRALHAHLESLRVAHEYEEFPGRHDWDYWDTHVRTALGFHAAALQLKPERQALAL